MSSILDKLPGEDELRESDGDSDLDYVPEVGERDGYESEEETGNPTEVAGSQTHSKKPAKRGRTDVMAERTVVGKRKSQLDLYTYVLMLTMFEPNYH